MTAEGNVVTVTKKGQATIPKQLRDKYGIKKKALVMGTNAGILFKPVPDPSDERGSLRKLFRGKSARMLIEESREQEKNHEKRLLKRYYK